MASGMPPSVANRKPSAVVVKRPASQSPRMGIPIQRDGAPEDYGDGRAPPVTRAHARAFRPVELC